MIFIYVTYPSEKDAQEISKVLLEARLVVCANIFPAHRSLYWWEGKVEDAQEVAVVYKTRRELFGRVEALIKEKHPYDVPCVVSLPVEQGSLAFLEWVKAESRG